jgi:branched-chain amino acid aminotransferase
MSSRITEATWIWKDGHLVLWKDGTVHLLSTAVQLFSSIFEGMRRHETPGGRAIFRLLQHLDCLMDPPTIYRMRPDATGCDRMRPGRTVERLTEGCRELIRANELGTCCFRPTILRG